MITTKLGTLERVDVRKAWAHEAYNFTPWLAQNLSRLSDELGVELEVEDTEVYIGPYRADIVARVPQTDELVLIENQLEWANLQHLGQVLAYLAGLEARIVIWIATGFLDEHLSAIRWLNEYTSNQFLFFCCAGKRRSNWRFAACPSVRHTRTSQRMEPPSTKDQPIW